MHVFLKETLVQEQKERNQGDEDGKINKFEIRIADFEQGKLSKMIIRCQIKHHVRINE